MADPSGTGEHPRVLLSAFLDDELDDAAATEVTAHLAGCRVCLDELAELRAARTALRGLPDVALPASLLATVTTAAERARHGQRRRRRRLVASGSVVGLVVSVLVLAFAVGSPAGDVNPPVQRFVVDHVVQHGGGPMIVPVDLNDR